MAPQWNIGSSPWDTNSLKRTLRSRKAGGINRRLLDRIAPVSAAAQNEKSDRCHSHCRRGLFLKLMPSCSKKCQTANQRIGSRHSDAGPLSSSHLESYSRPAGNPADSEKISHALVTSATLP